ncbi:MAG: methyltransferase domain-containing protein [Planctomycetota bacterium]
MTPELMDEPGASREQLADALAFIRGVNLRLGGRSGLIGWLRRWSWQWPTDRPVTLLDLGTGSADIPAAARAWALGAGFNLRITAADNHATTLDLARDHLAEAWPSEVAGGVELVECDAFGIVDRFGPGSFDYVHAGMFLHHLEDIDVATVLRLMERVASKGLVWNDLSRTWVARRAIDVLTTGQNAMVRHDAAVSVEKGFRRGEVLGYRERLGLSWCGYAGRFWTQRFELAGEKPGAWAGTTGRAGSNSRD